MLTAAIHFRYKPGLTQNVWCPSASSESLTENRVVSGSGMPCCCCAKLQVRIHADVREQRRDIPLSHRHEAWPSLQTEAGLKMPPVPYKGGRVKVFTYNVRENMDIGQLNYSANRNSHARECCMMKTAHTPAVWDTLRTHWSQPNQASDLENISRELIPSWPV